MDATQAPERGNARLKEARAAAEYVGLPWKQLYCHASKGHIPCVRVGRRVLFDVVQLEQFMATGGRGLDPAPAPATLTGKRRGRSRTTAGER